MCGAIYINIYVQFSGSASIGCFTFSTFLIILQHSGHFCNWKQKVQNKWATTAKTTTTKNTQTPRDQKMYSCKSLSRSACCSGLLEWLLVLIGFLYQSLGTVTLSTGTGPVKFYWCRGSHSLALDLASITGMGGEEEKKKRQRKKSCQEELPFWLLKQQQNLSLFSVDFEIALATGVLPPVPNRILCK